MKTLIFLFAFIFSAGAHAKCMNHAQIMNEIRQFAANYGGVSKTITESSPIYSVASNLVAAWKDLDNMPNFRRCGLALGPNDLRFVRTVGELAGVVMWNLNSRSVRTMAHGPQCAVAGTLCIPPAGACCSGLCSAYTDEHANTVTYLCE